MAKEMTAQKETSTAVALMAEMEADAGSGFENVGAENKAIPYLSLGQAISDRVKRGPEKVEGFDEGDFLNTATMEVFKAGSFRVVPCAFQMRWVEKDSLKSDARIIGIYTHDATIGCTKDDKGKFQNPEGNYIVPTAMHFVLILKADGSFVPAVISLQSSQLRRSKNWLSLMDGLKVKTAKGLRTPAMFSHSYAVGSISTSNADGSWMLWDFSAPKALEDIDIYNQAKAFYLEISKGNVKVAEPLKEDVAVSTSEHF